MQYPKDCDEKKILFSIMRYLVNRAYHTSLKINYEPNDETRHYLSTLGIWGELVGNKIINEGLGDI